MSDPEGLRQQCGWSAPYLVRRPTAKKRDVSFSERYRGTVYDSRVTLEVTPQGGIARGRTFVAVGAFAVATLVALIFLGRPPV